MRGRAGLAAFFTTVRRKQPDLPAARWSACLDRFRCGRRRQRQGRPDPPLRGRANPPAVRTGSGTAAGQDPGLRQFGILLAVRRRQFRKMRPHQYAHSADAAEPRPDQQQFRDAARRQCRRVGPRRSTPFGDAGARSEQLRAAIRQCGTRLRRKLSAKSIRRRDQSGRRLWRCRQHVPHRLRAAMRRVLFSGVLRNRSESFWRRRAHLQGAVSGCRDDALYVSQSWRRHEFSGLDQRPALHAISQRLQIPAGLRQVMQLPRGGTDVVGCVEEYRPARCNLAGRHHRD